MAMSSAFHTTDNARLQSARRSPGQTAAIVQQTQPWSYNLPQRKPDTCACGGGCPRCRANSDLQIGAPDDAYEREADAVAERVMRMEDTGAGTGRPAASGLQRRCARCELEGEMPLVQTKPAASSPQAPGVTAPPSIREALNGPGLALAPETRAYFEPRFGRDFSGVRVHTGGAAEQSARNINAHAYTVGHNIVFDTGRYAPGTHEGRHLLAHELTHVVQQRDGRVSRRVQRFTTAEHTEIGNLAYELASREMSAVGLNSPLLSLLIQGSRFRWGERVKTYGDIVADADFFDTFGDFLHAQGERATGIAGTIDEARLATRNLPHFTPHNIRRWKEQHGLAIDRMVFAHGQLQFAMDLLRDIDPLLEGARRAILAGEDERSERLLNAYRVRFERVRPRIERIIPAARRLAWEALLQNGFAEHYLTDAFAAGHLVTPRNEILREVDIGPEERPPSRAEAVRGALFTSWSELRELRAQARSLAWHDLDNFYGVEVRAADPGLGPWIACGDRCSERSGPSHWHATRASAIRANEESIKDLWRAGLNGERPTDFSSVLDLLPRPTWRNYPGWGAAQWRNQLKFIRGESPPHAPGTQLPDIVSTVLWPIEHCVELEAGCAFPFVGTSRDWVERWSYDAWVRPWINRVKASATTRYEYAAM